MVEDMRIIDNNWGAVFAGSGVLKDSIVSGNTALGVSVDGGGSYFGVAISNNLITSIGSGIVRGAFGAPGPVLHHRKRSGVERSRQ